MYGQSADKIIQGNVANIIFLKSDDDSMLETLSKMSGKRHVSRINSKTITRNQQRIFMANEGKISYTASTSEEPVITYNDMAFLSERNSIVFSAGKSPIWNRNQLILPMSWRLLKNTIKEPGQKFSFGTLPTLSTARDFDVRHNQPNFDKMLKKRITQALVVKDQEEIYKQAYGYNDYQISTQDPNEYSATIMRMVNYAIVGASKAKVQEEKVVDADTAAALGLTDDSNDMGSDDNTVNESDGGDNITDTDAAMTDADPEGLNKMLNSAQNSGQEEITAQQRQKYGYDRKMKKIFANGTICPNDIYSLTDGAMHNYDKQLILIYKNNKGSFINDKVNFSVAKDGSLLSADKSKTYIKAGKVSAAGKAAQEINKAAKDKKTSTYADGKVEVPQSMTVTDAFYKFLSQQPSWEDIANGVIESQMTKEMSLKGEAD